jgi:hypothetical protein
MIDSREHATIDEIDGVTDRAVHDDDRTDLIVLSLFTASALLVGVGVVTGAPLPWIAGAAAFVTTFAVDRRRRSRSR